MTRAVLPSTTHSTVVSGPMESTFRTHAGTDTCPRRETLVRMTSLYKALCQLTRERQIHHVYETSTS
jgi:hypothetical protein